MKNKWRAYVGFRGSLLYHYGNVCPTGEGLVVNRFLMRQRVVPYSLVEAVEVSSFGWYFPVPAVRVIFSDAKQRTNSMHIWPVFRSVNTIADEILLRCPAASSRRLRWPLGLFSVLPVAAVIFWIIATIARWLPGMDVATISLSAVLLNNLVFYAGSEPQVTKPGSAEFS